MSTAPELEAGHNLDSLVADKVMAWRVHGTLVFTPTGDWWDYGNPLTGPWSPSTNIANAWEVLGRFDTYMVQRRNDGERFWHEAQVTDFDRDLFGYAQAATMELAICYAALDAVTEKP